MQDAVHPDALTIFGAAFDETLDDEIRVTVIATGFAEGQAAQSGSGKAGSAAAPSPINFEEEKAAAEADAKVKWDEEDDPYTDIFKIFNREK